MSETTKPTPALLAVADHQRLTDELDAMAKRSAIIANVLNLAYGSSWGLRAQRASLALLRLKGEVDGRFYSQTPEATRKATPMTPDVYPAPDAAKVIASTRVTTTGPGVYEGSEADWRDGVRVGPLNPANFALGDGSTKEQIDKSAAE